MATSTDPRAAGFDAAAFRDAITFAMNMGLPDTASERITFRWTEHRDYGTEDEGGDPFDWTSTPSTSDQPADVLVSAAVEFISRSTLSGDNAVGPFDTPRVIVTLLDTEYPSITAGTPERRADRMVIGGNTYEVDYVAPPMGLFDVTVYQVYGSAVDET